MTIRKSMIAAVLGFSLISGTASAGSTAPIASGSDNGGAIIAVAALAIITFFILGKRAKDKE